MNKKLEKYLNEGNGFSKLTIVDSETDNEIGLYKNGKLMRTIRKNADIIDVLKDVLGFARVKYDLASFDEIVGLPKDLKEVDTEKVTFLH